MKLTKRALALAIASIMGATNILVPVLSYADKPVVEEVYEDFKVEAEVIEDNSKGIEVKIRLPKVSGLTDQDFEKRLNEEMRNEVMDSLKSFKKEAKKDSAFLVDFKVSYYKNLASIELMEYSIGAYDANGSNIREFYNVDLNRNRLVNLSDILDRETNYEDLIIKKIEKEENLFDQDIKLEEILRENNFKFTSNGDLILAFDQGVIKPRSEGFVDIVISESEIRKHLRNLVRIEKGRLKSKRTNLETDISYPIILGMKDRDFELKVNNLIKSNVETSLREFEKEAPADSFYFTGYIVRGYEHILSIEVTEYKIRYGDANGELTKTIYNLDLKNNKLLRMGDLFPYGSQYIKELTKNVKADMAKNKDKYFLNEFEEVSQKDSFYINGFGEMVISYPEGYLAPHSEGSSEFTIDKNKLKEISSNFTLIGDEYINKDYKFKIKVPKLWHDKVFVEQINKDGKNLRVNFYYIPSNPDINREKLASLYVREASSKVNVKGEEVLLKADNIYSIDTIANPPYGKGSEARLEYEKIQESFKNFKDLFSVTE